MKTVAVIVAAYNAEHFILDCYKSIKNQKMPAGYKLDIRIGVDGSAKTSEALKGIKHYYSYNNVGAYIMRNSLIKIAPSDIYAYFDADDIMLPDYISQSLSAINKTGIVLTGKYQVTEDMKTIKTSGAENGGAMTFTHEVLGKLGGFYPARCAADTDFMKRAAMAGHNPTMINIPLYYRRRHNGSLTKAIKTGMGSPYRKKVWAEMCDARKRGIIKIKPVVTELELRNA